jgi:c-di-GMP-binding flagellar brake protein YcgR
MTNAQKRNFVRLDVMFTIEYYKIDDDVLEPQIFKATSRDISGGGMRFHSKEIIELDTELEMKLNLTSHNQVSVCGKVVRCFPMDTIPGYSIGVEFILLDKKDREKIIKFIFDRQRELRQKGLL